MVLTKCLCGTNSWAKTSAGESLVVELDVNKMYRMPMMLSRWCWMSCVNLPSKTGWGLPLGSKWKSWMPHVIGVHTYLRRGWNLRVAYWRMILGIISSCFFSDEAQSGVKWANVTTNLLDYISCFTYYIHVTRIQICFKTAFVGSNHNTKSPVHPTQMCHLRSRTASMLAPSVVFHRRRIVCVSSRSTYLIQN